LIRIVAEDKHNRDGFYNEPDMVNFIKVDSPSPNKNDKKKKESSRNESIAWNFIASFFGRKEEDKANENGRREFICDPRGLKFTGEQDDEQSYGKLDFKAFPLPSNTRLYSFTSLYNNSTIGPSRTSCSLPTSLLDTMSDRPSHNNSIGKGNLRRQRTLEDPLHVQNPRHQMNNITTKLHSEKKKDKLLRQHSSEDFTNYNRSSHIQIGRKRTLTDETGRIRQEVAL
jgi:hypothetical protein